MAPVSDALERAVRERRCQVLLAPVGGALAVVADELRGVGAAAAGGDQLARGEPRRRLRRLARPPLLVRAAVGAVARAGAAVPAATCRIPRKAII